MNIEQIKKVESIHLNGRDCYTVELIDGNICHVPHDLANKDFPVVQRYLNQVKKG